MTQPSPQSIARTSMSLLDGHGIRYGTISTRADRALKVLDRERATSAPGILDLFARDAGTVRADANLSAIGQGDRIKSMAASRLENLAELAKEIQAIEAEYLADEREALRLADPSQNDTMVDLALVAMFREQGSDVAKVKLQGSARMRLAIARLPAELSGVNPEQHSKILHTLLNPTIAARLDGESQALAAARQAVQAAIDVLSAKAQASHSQLVALFGNAWKLGGATTPEERKARITSALAAEATAPVATL